MHCFVTHFRKMLAQILVTCALRCYPLAVPKQQPHALHGPQTYSVPVIHGYVQNRAARARQEVSARRDGFANGLVSRGVPLHTHAYFLQGITYPCSVPNGYQDTHTFQLCPTARLALGAQVFKVKSL
jgi:hypothetical protein